MINEEILGQFAPPLEKRKYRYEPVMYMCDGKVVKYDMRGLHIWRALVSTSYTMLSDSDTWNHLGILTVVCFLSMGICIMAGSYKSVQDTTAVASKAITLISFIFAIYTSTIINRWDRVRNTTLGQHWGSIENLNVIAFRILKYDTPQENEIVNRVIRYSRLSLQLEFLALQGNGDLSELYKRKLITDAEKQWLDQARISTRPYMAATWISELFDEILELYDMHEIYKGQVVNSILTLRNGIQATIAAVETQLPYPYVHCVYWIIQLLLVCLSVETGVILASNVYYKVNGEGFYSPPDDNVTWPQQPDVWYLNKLFQVSVANVLFVLFTEGMLKICDKLSNPMSLEDSSFAERVYDAFLHNNCKSMRAGALVYNFVSDAGSTVVDEFTNNANISNINNNNNNNNHDKKKA